MAKITTITNPLTGQPAQVDQLDHTAQQIDDAIARALPGGAIDIALQNKAPAGYGLGMNANSSIYYADNITAFGFYTAKTNTPTNNWRTILNIPYGQNRATQFSTLGESVSGNKYSYCKREKIDGIWKPWEWVNPRMELGVEYRTTERYLGKPVYVKAIDFGAAPNNTAKAVSIGSANIEAIVDFKWMYANGNDIGMIITNLDFTLVAANTGNVVIEANTNMSSIMIKAVVKYIKTTD